MTRADVLRRVKALHAKNASSGCGPDEVLMARQKAAELVRRHSVQLYELVDVNLYPVREIVT